MHEHLVSLTPCFSTVVRREARWPDLRCTTSLKRGVNEIEKQNPSGDKSPERALKTVYCRQPNKRGHAGHVRCRASALGRWQEGPQRLRPFPCCCSCRS